MKNQLVQYILLLRGINVGGRNKISMDELKAQLISLGLDHVLSYINSGNLLFDSPLSLGELRERILELLEKEYGFPIPFALIPAPDYVQAFTDLPDWWNESAARRDVLFYISETERERIAGDIQTMKLHCENVHFTNIGIFWAKFNEKEFLKTAYHKQLIKKDYYRRVTIRNGNTAEHILGMLHLCGKQPEETHAF